MNIVVSALARFNAPTGICRFASSLVSMLARDPEVSRITLIIGAWQEAYYERCFFLNEKNLNVRTVKIGNNSIDRNLWCLRGLPKMARAERADLVHLAYPTPFVRSRFHCPVIATIHDLYPYDFPENFGFPAYFLNRAFLRICVSQANGLCCVSAQTRERVRAVLGSSIGAQRVIVAGNIVEEEKIDSVRPDWVRNSGNGRLLLSVAQHRKNKRLDILIKAFACLRMRGKLSKKSQLVIVGDRATETRKLESLIHALALGNSVALISGIRDEELNWLYENADACVLASSIEGFCLPLMEALKHRARVVCTDIPIFRELGAEGCHYFDGSGDAAESLANALMKALESPRPEFVDLRRFSASRLRTCYMEFYREVIQTSRVSC